MYIVSIILLLLVLLSVGLLFMLSVENELYTFLIHNHYILYWMILVGFFAEIVAGSIGMGYGVICTTILIFLGVPPAIVSASIHSAETFTTAAASYTHYQLGNVNAKIIKALALPAIVGAVLGALALIYAGQRYAKWVKLFIALYTLYLGVNILMVAFKSKEKKKIEFKRKTNMWRLGLLGGFIDSFAGGGWGPLVTGTLIKNGRTPRYVVGSSTVAKFILTITSAVILSFHLEANHWNIVLGLLVGGIISVPFSARLTAKIAAKKMFFIVGCIVVVMSVFTLVKAMLS